MGSLANLYISQSYTSLIHLGSDTTASANFAELQDGLGNGLGISVNTEGDISASNSVKTLDLFVMNDTELSGAFNLNTYITASTPAYFNSIQPYFSDVVYVTGSYPTNNYPPTIADVEVGWICNGINVTNGIVTAVSKSVSGYYITVGGQFPQQAQSYTFRGRTSPTAHIYGALEISENLVVSGTFDIEGKVVVNDDVVVNGTLSVSGSTSITGALDVRETLTASAGLIENDLIVSGTLYAREVVTLIESSSIIYSSGSNILGDEVSDIQTLIGTTIISGSGVVSGSITVSNNISSSTISGIGNVTLYSQSVDSRLVYIETTFSTSVDSRLDYLEGPFSTSVDLRLDEVEATASYLNTTFSTSVDSRLDVVEATASLYVPFSTSVDSRLDELEAFSSSLVVNFATQAELNAATASLINQIDTKLNTSSFNAYTQSTDTTINNLSSSVASDFNVVNGKINGLSSFTGSYATTGSNNFIGNQTITGSLNITGSMVYSGSVAGVVIPLTITSNTASMNCSLGNFFTLTLVSGSNTRLEPTNIKAGETLSLLITQPSTPGTISYPSSIKFVENAQYTASILGNSIDILTLLSFDTTTLYGASANKLV